ncbi:hypothetical protein ABE65_005015 [Fictibacillus phosphorivorans]|uniref:Uncharacterized protein n=2 Tax=Fictibacillus phosphorivorans TaxID=1221500 RepID=A0A160IJF1_9BACL|nr:hypothetical protein ABE65_005015 [Fictibacillus phosphorivorans]
MVCLIFLLTVGCTSFDSSNEIKVTAEMNEMISEYIIQHYEGVYPETDKKFEVHKVYGAKEMGGETSVYLYSLFLGFNKKTKAEGQSGHSVPAVIKLKSSDDKYVVSYYKEPSDGADFKRSLYKIFPRKYAGKALEDTKNSAGLHKEMKRKAEMWLRK